VTGIYCGLMLAVDPMQISNQAQRFVSVVKPIGIVNA
jgi:hypothetical protein